METGPRSPLPRPPESGLLRSSADALLKQAGPSGCLARTRKGRDGRPGPGGRGASCWGAACGSEPAARWPGSLPDAALHASGPRAISAAGVTWLMARGPAQASGDYLSFLPRAPLLHAQLIATTPGASMRASMSPHIRRRCVHCLRILARLGSVLILEFRVTRMLSNL